MSIPQIKLLNVGEIRSSPKFRSDKYIYPVGYKASRQFTSLKNHTQLATYICSVEDKDGTPEFVVTCCGQEFRGKTPTEPWSQILDKLPRVSRATCSGPKKFGFALKRIQDAIHEEALLQSSNTPTLTRRVKNPLEKGSPITKLY